MSKDIQKTLSAMQSLALTDLDNTSDEHIRAEILEDGGNPDEIANEIAERLDSIVAEFMRNRVAANKAVKSATTIPTQKLKPSLEEIKRLIQKAFEREPKLAALFREGTKQSENDLLSLYEDLVSMGTIDANDDAS
jgi:predicted nucleotide-binding protein